MLRLNIVSKREPYRIIVTLKSGGKICRKIIHFHIANLSQGMLVGSGADNIDEKIEQKIFHARIIIDTAFSLPEDAFLNMDTLKMNQVRCNYRAFES